MKIIPNQVDHQSKVKSMLFTKDFKEWMNSISQEPKKSSIKTHKEIKIKVNGQWMPMQYLPIEIIRAKLVHFFAGIYKEEILREGKEMNSLYTVVRLHYWHPFIQEWMYLDGIGAKPLKTKKDSDNLDMSNMIYNSVELGYPSAATQALKNAAAKMGPAFGLNLNKGLEYNFKLNTNIENHYSTNLEQLATQ